MYSFPPNAPLAQVGLSACLWPIWARRLKMAAVSESASIRCFPHYTPPRLRLEQNSNKDEPNTDFSNTCVERGGFLGLYTAEILTRLERQAGRPLGQCFDLIAGTSVGGILAIGLALEVPADRMRDVFRVNGERIFSSRPRPRWGWLDARRSLLSPKYDGAELRRAITEMIGAGTTLADAKHRLLVPAVNMTKGSVQMFKTGHNRSFVIDPRRSAVDVAMATSAAPTYFPLAELDSAQYVDGGLVANAPDQCALHEAVHFLDQEASDVRILSVGTTSTGFSLKRSLGRNLGSLKWMSRGRLFATIVSAQQQLVDYMLGHQLGDRYLRIDASQSEEQQADLALDVADQDAQGTLLGLAEGSYQKFSADPRLAAFLSHVAPKPDFFNSAGG
jgi:patatin-like phospholipase/acyl hydrolase